MKIITVTTTILLIVFQGYRTYSQPVIEKADILPKIGDVYEYKQQNGVTSIAQIKGQDVIWNFDNSSFSGRTKYILIADPSDTPFNANFPGADFCEVSFLQDTTYVIYSYQEVNNDILEENGSAYAIPGGTIYANYDNIHALMQFPLQYADSIIDLYHGTVIDYPKETFSRHGKRTYKVDGYGTLIYSTGDTISDVLRVYARDYYVDSTFASYDSNFSYTTSWYKAGIRAPLIFQRGGGFWSYIYADQLIIATGGSFYKYLDPSYIHEQLTAIDQAESSTVSDFVVYPNPSMDRQITITGLVNIDELKIINTLGEVIHYAKPNNQNYSVQLNEAGMYVAQLRAGGHTFLKKILLLN